MAQREVVVGIKGTCASEGMGSSRPAAWITSLANRFANTKITIIQDGREANAKRLLTLIMTFSRTMPGERVVVVAEGEEDEEAVEVLGNLVSEGKGAPRPVGSPQFRYLL